jgi:hypothetical protein
MNRRDKCTNCLGVFSEELRKFLGDFGLDGSFEQAHDEREVNLNPDVDAADLDASLRSFGCASRSLEDDSVALPVPLELESLLHRLGEVLRTSLGLVFGKRMIATNIDSGHLDYLSYATEFVIDISVPDLFQPLDDPIPARGIDRTTDPLHRKAEQNVFGSRFQNSLLDCPNIVRRAGVSLLNGAVEVLRGGCRKLSRQHFGVISRSVGRMPAIHVILSSGVRYQNDPKTNLPGCVQRKRRHGCPFRERGCAGVRTSIVARTITRIGLWDGGVAAG